MDLSTHIKNANPFKPEVSEDIKQMIRKNFTREIEFYQFCRQRLFKQYLAIKQNDLRELEVKENKAKMSFLNKALMKFK